MSNTIPVVTVDGPGGSGKGTLSRLLAGQLHWHWLDSGAIYRLLALSAERNQIDPTDADALANAALALQVEFRASQNDEPATLLAGEDVTPELRTETCGAAASKVASIPAVRDALLQRQRDFRQDPGLVADGRDMGTVVFPQAELKLFLTASLEERAQRRYKQLKAQGLAITMSDLLGEISARDERDANRTAAPLRPADDAIVIDCSEMTIDEMLATAMAHIRERKLVA